MLKTSDLFKVLSDETRGRILTLLGEQELCVCDLMAVLDTIQPKISRHLTVLKRYGLVKERRARQWRHYRLSEQALANPILTEARKTLREESMGKRDLRTLEVWLREKQGNRCEEEYLHEES